MINTVADNGTIRLGLVNDNKATVIQFPVANYFSLFGEGGTFYLLNKRPEDANAYAVPSEYVAVQDEILNWTLTNYDVAQPGNGECQLSYYIGDVCKMSQRWRTAIGASLVSTGTVPEPTETWLDELDAIADRAEAAATRAEEAETKTPHIGSNGNWLIWDAVNEQWVDSGTSARPSFVVVGALPAEGQSGIIYLVPSADPGVENIYDEYIWVGTDYELIGTTAIDLSGYVPKTWINGTSPVDGDLLLKTDNEYDATIYSDNDVNLQATVNHNVTAGNDVNINASGGITATCNGDAVMEGYGGLRVEVSNDLSLYSNSGNARLSAAGDVNIATDGGDVNVWADTAADIGANMEVTIHSDTEGITLSGSHIKANGYDLATVLAATLIHDTASDTLAAFPDGASGFNADDVKVELPNGSPTVTEITLWANGVNCYDEEVELGTINASTGEKIPNVSRIRSKNYIPVKPSTTYFYKSSTNDQLLFYTADKTFISGTYRNNSTFNTPATARFVLISYNSGYGTTYLNDGGINYPSTETAYKAYNGTKYAVNLPVSVNEGSLDLTTGKLTVVSPTPGTYSLTPTVIPIKQGQNNIIADVGTTTVQYVANTKLYIDKQ